MRKAITALVREKKNSLREQVSFEKAGEASKSKSYPWSSWSSLVKASCILILMWKEW